MWDRKFCALLSFIPERKGRWEVGGQEEHQRPSRKEITSVLNTMIRAGMDG